VSGWPAVHFAEAAARAWLLDPEQHDDDPADLFSEHFPAYGDGGVFLANVNDLVYRANAAGLFGDQVDVAVPISSDSDGTMDGGYVFVGFPRTYGSMGTGWVRLSSLHHEHSYLTNDTAATGVDGALSILQSVAQTAHQVLDDARQVLAGLRPEQQPQQRPSGSGSTHPTQADGDTGAPRSNR